MAEEAKAKGDAAFGKRDYRGAIRHYSAAIALDPGNHVLYSNRSAAYAYLEQWPHALADAQKSVELNYRWSRGYLRLGVASLGLGRSDTALQAFKRGLFIDPDDEALKSGYERARAEVQRKMEPLKPHPFGDVFQAPEMWEKLNSDTTTSVFAQQNDFVEMMRDIQRDCFRINDYSKDPRLLHALGVLLNVNFRAASPDYPAARAESDPPSEEQVTEKEKPPTAEKKEASASEEKDAPASEDKEEKGAAATEEKETTEQKEAAASEEKDAPAAATEEKEEMVAAAIEEKEVEIEEDEQKVLESAMEQYFTAMGLDDEDDKAILRLGMKESLQYAGDFGDFTHEIGVGDASASASKAEESTGKETALALKSSAYQAALESLRKSLSENRYPDLLSTLHDASRLAKELEEMLSEDPKILDSDTQSEGDSTVQAYSNRAACYMKLGEFSEALKDADKCIEIEPKSPLGYRRKGNALFSLEEFDQATAVYIQGLEDNPTDSHLFDGLTKCMKRNNGDQFVEESKTSQDEAVPKPASHPDKEDEAAAQPSLDQEKGDENAPAAAERGGSSGSSELHKEVGRDETWKVDDEELD